MLELEQHHGHQRVAQLLRVAVDLGRRAQHELEQLDQLVHGRHVHGRPAAESRLAQHLLGLAAHEAQKVFEHRSLGVALDHVLHVRGVRVSHARL